MTKTGRFRSIDDYYDVGRTIKVSDGYYYKKIKEGSWEQLGPWCKLLQGFDCEVECNKNYILICDLRIGVLQRQEGMI